MSQPEPLAAQMEAAGIRRGERVRATVRHARIDKDAVVFFCDVSSVEVLARVGGGDGAPLPRRGVVVDELRSLLGGYVDLLDVELFADEVLHVRGHEATVVTVSGGWGARVPPHAGSPRSRVEAEAAAPL